MIYTVRFFGVLAMVLGVQSGAPISLELPEGSEYGSALDAIRTNLDVNATVFIGDAQYIYRDVPEGYVYPSTFSVPYFSNLPGSYAGETGTDHPVNGYCTIHNAPA